MSLSAPEPVVIAWGTASAPLPGQTESGDLAVVSAFTDGALLVVIDGLGHGPEAALAARTAQQLVTAHPGADLVHIVERCHQGLRKTRGVVMSLASFHVQTSLLTWLGVGNVEGVLLRISGERRCESLSSRGGVVGYRLPPLRSESLPVVRGDTLVLATDGFRADFKIGIDPTAEPQSIADTLMARSAKGSDDACVAVARYVALPSARVTMRHVSDAAVARQRLREFAYRRGFQEVAVEGLATALSELAHNIIAHAGTGEITITFAEEGSLRGLCIVARDNGPGIADIARCLDDGYSTAGSLGLGLSSARRFVDVFELASTPGQGTEVTLKKWLP
jgi:negative regulator of sigma-B (phosphoserine phosphatase)